VKKSCALLCLILFLSSCATSEVDLPSETTTLPQTQEMTDKPEPSSESSSAPSETEVATSEINEPSSKSTLWPESEFAVSEKYTHSGNWGNPEFNPAITFYAKNRCTLFINYMEGCCDVVGTYSVEGDTIKVDVELRGTLFEGKNESGYPYMEDQCSFKIVSDKEIVLETDFDFWRAGDSFVKQ